MSNHKVGGQAVLEGVMMRGENEWSVAVRTPENSITTTKRELNSVIARHSFFKKPLVRGVVSLGESLILGIKALSYSANVSLGEEEEEISGKEWAITIIMAVIFVVGLFMITPYYLTKFLSPLKGNVLFAIVEGVFRLSIFLAYILLISMMKDVRRVFQYHGAEHKVINAFEAGEELSPENAERYSTAHTRCGTSFLLIVMVVAIFTFSFLPTSSVVERILGKVVLIPVIAGVAYELVRLASRRPESAVLRALLWPGMMLQKLTTREPDRGQVEVALAALSAVLPAREPEPSVQ